MCDEITYPFPNFNGDTVGDGTSLYVCIMCGARPDIRLNIKASHRKNCKSRSHEIGCWKAYMALKFGRRLSSSAVANSKTLNTSRICLQFAKSCETPADDIEKVPYGKTDMRWILSYLILSLTYLVPPPAIRAPKAMSSPPNSASGMRTPGILPTDSTSVADR